MSFNFREWAARHAIPFAAIAELEAALGMDGCPNPDGEGKTEAFVQSQVRLEAARYDAILYRNNVGGTYDEYGNFIRYGLANDNAKMNKKFKSSDLVGVRRVLITPQHVGQTIGRALFRECKEPGWRYAGDEREEAQLRFITLMQSYGADAAFAAGPGSFDQ